MPDASRPPSIYDIKRGHWKNIDGDKLPALIGEHFGDVATDGDAFVSKFGAIRSLRVHMVSKTELHVWTEMDPTVAEDAQRQTISAWNRFLEAATGFTAKQRNKRAQEKIKKGA